MDPEMTNKSPEDERLSELLAEWKVEASLPPRFQEQVWNRIAKGEAAKPVSAWIVLSGWIENTFTRPAMAVSYLAILLFAGLGAGFWQAHGKTARGDTEWRARYVQMVDPYQMPRELK